MYLQQAVNYSETALEMSKSGTMGLAKFYVLMMKISYNRISLNEKKKRMYEKEIIKIAEKIGKQGGPNILKEVEAIIKQLADGDETCKVNSNLMRTNNNALEKIRIDIVKLIPESIRHFEKAQEIVEFNLGEYHYFFASLYC